MDNDTFSNQDLLDLLRSLSDAFAANDADVTPCLIVPVRTSDGGFQDVVMTASPEQFSKVQAIAEKLGLAGNGMVH